MLAMDSIGWLTTGPCSFDLALLGVVIAAQMTEPQLGSLLRSMIGAISTQGYLIGYVIGLYSDLDSKFQQRSPAMLSLLV
jgi:hypothetical protein